jgi:uncharacterized membrane protein YeiH
MRRKIKSIKFLIILMIITIILMFVISVDRKWRNLLWPCLPVNVGMYVMIGKLS